MDIKDKQKVWDETRSSVDHIVDGLEEHVDEGIKETVTALMVHGFVTIGSCGGHLERSLLYPWVDFCTVEPTGWKEDKRIIKQWEAANRIQYKRMLELLGYFYFDRKVKYDAMLILDCANFAGFRLESIGGFAVDGESDEIKQEKLTLYCREMQEFAEFLKNKYFSG